MPRLAAGALVILGSATMGMPAQADVSTITTTGVEVQLGHLVNAERARGGLAPLRIDVRLVAASRTWAAQMAREETLGHDPGLRQASPPDATLWGENVGHATGDDPGIRIHELLVASPAHRANILDPRFTDLGVGVAETGGGYWMSQRFTAGAPARVSPAVEPTAIAARQVFGGGQARQAVLVRDDVFADALAAAPLAGHHGPLLFTPPGPALYPVTRQALEHGLPRGGTVWVVGGSSAVDPQVVAELQEAGWAVQRVSAADRIGTAAAVARTVSRRDGLPATVLLATAGDWPDAATASAYGSRTGAPILLSHAHRLPDETAAVLRELAPARVIALGGVHALSERAVSDAGAERVAGATRQDTAAEIALRLWGKTSAEAAPAWTITPAAGDTWAFAIGVAPLAARADTPVLLVASPLSTGLRDYLAGLGYHDGVRADLRLHGPVDPAAREDVQRLVNG
jgi:putative cell wall-binding protein